MVDRPPLAVLVGGAPGSGKTTLSEALGVGLDLPVLHKDRLVHGRWRTLETATRLGESGVEQFYRSMEMWIEMGISLVVDFTYFPVIGESDVVRRLAPHSTLINVHCSSRNSFERWEQKMRNDPLCGEMRLQKLIPDCCAASCCEGEAQRRRRRSQHAIRRTLGVQPPLRWLAAGPPAMIGSTWRFPT